MAKSKNHLDISVLIATYNRADILRQTLENMTCLDRDGLSVEFVVVDNNSSDHTKEAIESFTDRLPIFYLFESRPGKNCALNKALNEVPLGRLVAFTDDDVEPKKDWLKAIITVTNHWPDYSVFGGKILPLWPHQKLPPWIEKLIESGGVLPIHDHGNFEMPFPSQTFPAGANLWVRSQILTNRRFDEQFGPCPKSRLMGSETSFIKKLEDDGYRALYCPDAVVGHYFPAESLSLSAIKKRAYRAGRTAPHLWGLKPKELYEKHRFLWWLWRTLALMKNLLAYGVAMTSLSQDKRILGSLRVLKGIAYNVESFRLACRNPSNVRQGK